jgi:hypothetical protein
MKVIPAIFIVSIVTRFLKAAAASPLIVIITIGLNGKLLAMVVIVGANAICVVQLRSSLTIIAFMMDIAQETVPMKKKPITDALVAVLLILPMEATATIAGKRQSQPRLLAPKMALTTTLALFVEIQNLKFIQKLTDIATPLQPKTPLVPRVDILLTPALIVEILIPMDILTHLATMK